jgi:hypothetical protein
MTLASARQLIAHSGDEIVEGRDAQMSKEMIEDPCRFDTINRMMHKLLDRFAADSSGRHGRLKQKN